MPKYYRFQNEMPAIGEEAHCFTNKEEFVGFVKMMKAQDSHFGLMKFWEIEGEFRRHDEGDVIVRVISARQIRI